MRTITVALAALTLGAAGCTIGGVIRSNEVVVPEDQAYLKELETQPLTFEISRAAAEDAWGRAHTFLSKYSSMKIQSASDYALQTFNPIFQPAMLPPSLGSVTYGYHVLRTPDGDKFKFEVACLRVQHPMKDAEIARTADRNARILAHYIVTGQLPRNTGLIIQ